MDVILYSKIANAQKEIDQLDDAVYAEPTKVYLTPYAIASNCYVYLPNDNFYYGKNYSYANVIVYQIQKGIEYTINYTAFVGKLDVVATAETYFAVPDSGYGTGVKYVEKYTSTATGNKQIKLTPSKDGYLYLQLSTEKNANKAVSYDQAKALRTSNIDAVARKTAYKVLQNGIMLSTKYDSSHDIQYIINKHGLNELPDFQNVYIYGNNDGRSIIHDTDDNCRVIYGNGDWHAPYQIKAVNNIDGDSTSGTWFTGGGHGYENATSEASKTARNLGIKYFADGVEISEDDEGVAETVVICWVNQIQASNTEKTDGTGREVLKETITLTFKDNVFHSRTEFEPLEEVNCLLWYGLQIIYQSGSSKTIQYIGAENRQLYSYDVESESGDKTTNTAKLRNGETHMVQEFSVNPLVDLGRRNYCKQNLTKAMFGKTYGKAYATVINTSTNMLAGEKYVLEGEYKIYKDIVIQ